MGDRPSCESPAQRWTVLVICRSFFIFLPSRFLCRSGKIFHFAG